MKPRRPLGELGGPPPPPVPPCDWPGCGRDSAFRRRLNPGTLQEPVYAELYCGLHVPADWLQGRAKARHAA